MQRVERTTRGLHLPVTRSCWLGDRNRRTTALERAGERRFNTLVSRAATTPTPGRDRTSDCLANNWESTGCHGGFTTGRAMGPALLSRPSAPAARKETSPQDQESNEEHPQRIPTSRSKSRGDRTQP